VAPNVAGYGRFRGGRDKLHERVKQFVILGFAEIDLDSSKTIVTGARQEC